MPIFPTTIIGDQARESLQAENQAFVTIPFGEPGHETNILFAEDGFFADISDTEFGPGTGNGSGRGMIELGRLHFKTAYDESTPEVGIISLRRGLMDICPGGAGGPYHFAY